MAFQATAFKSQIHPPSTAQFRNQITDRKSDTPAFVLAKLDDLAGDKKLMDSIGGQTYFEFSFNKNDFKFGDTVNYSITIKGSTRILNYKGSHVKTKPDTWILYKEALVISN